MFDWPDRRASAVALLVILAGCAGCGTTRERTATEQLLLSDAVDRAVARVDFSPLSGEKIFLDSQYVRQVKVKGFVTADYIISSLRQQMLAAGCLVQEDREEADYVVEARVGALGTDAHDVNYGVPANKSLSTAASLVAGATAVPTIPEISVARRADESAAAKLALFAYDRQTRERVWQSGMKVGRSSAQDRWYFGAGPFQSGTIYEDYFRVQDQLVSTPLHKRSARSLKEVESGPDEAYRSMAVWNKKLRTKAFEFAGGTSTDGHTGGKEEASATEPTNPATTDRAVQPASHGTRVSDKP